MTKILICDDERDIVSALKIYLEAEGYTTAEAHTGAEALEVLDGDPSIRLVLLDVMMPVMDGITALSLLRETHNLPVILLTAKGEDTDKVLGLNLGADDYVTKPFNPVELLARVRSQLRRYTTLGGEPASQPDTLTVGGLTLDDRRKQVTVDGDPVNLTPTEYDILKLCMENPDTVLSPKEIYRRVWKEAPLGAEGVVAVHIRHLREKIEIDPAAPRYIRVVWGKGYVLKKGGNER